VPSNLLGATENTFAVLGGSAVTNIGPTIVNGSLGVSPGSAITGFPPGIVVAPGTIHDSDAVALQVQTELTTSYNTVAGLPVTTSLTGQNLGGLTLTPGVYNFSSSAQLTGTLTLNDLGNPNALFAFQIGSTLTTASNSAVVYLGGARVGEENWQVGSSATLGTDTSFAGNILALTSISLDTGASIQCGRALARNGAVTMDANNITTVCASPPGSISGMKFIDLSGDGIQVLGDPGLAGVTVFLDLNHDGTLDPGDPSTTTNASGDYTFANLLPGTYSVREVLPTGYIQTTPNPAAITLVSGAAVSGVNFGDFKLVSISGTKFNDLNGNGVRDPGEPGLAGVTIFIDLHHDGTLDPGDPRTTTNTSGNFTFANLGPGTYSVHEVVPPGFIQMTSNPVAIVVSSGTNVTGILFGNTLATSLIAPSKLLLIGHNLANLLNGTFAAEASFVANLYETLLGRAPDLAGMQLYLDLLLAGYTEPQVAAIFKANFHL
jgi:hypothetical protein